MTLAQLGLPESFTPARWRFPTRMFPAEKEGEYEPHKIRERRQEIKPSNGPAPKQDVEMKDQPSQEGTSADAPKAEGTGETKVEGAENTADGEKEGTGEAQTVEEIFFEEDIASEEGAVFPMENGRIVDWPCFFALLTHVYNTLSPPFHTPIMLIAEPVWSLRDKEAITQFIFEKFKTPAFSLMDAAAAVCYGYGTGTATVVDVGKDKVDVTAVTDFLVNEHGRGVALEGCGGDYLTDRLLELLGSKGFTREMCEQLKRSNITELLPAGTPVPGAAATARQDVPPPAPQPEENGQPKPQNGAAENGEDEGVLDVAAIVSGNTSEYLAARDEEQGPRKGSEQAAKPVRQANSKKEKATFQYQEFVKLEPENDAPGGTGRFIRQSRDIEVGVERFLAATPKQKTGNRLGSSMLEDIATQIHHTILAVPDATKRSELWDSLIIVGNGSKIKG